MSSPRADSKPTYDGSSAEEVTRLKAVLSEPRRRIVAALSRGPGSTRLISEATGLSRSLVNHHLQILVTAGLVRQSGEMSLTYYELTEEGRRLLGFVDRAETRRPAGPDRTRRAGAVACLLALFVLSVVFLYSWVKGQPHPLWVLGFAALALPLTYASARGFTGR